MILFQEKPQTAWNVLPLESKGIKNYPGGLRDNEDDSLENSRVRSVTGHTSGASIESYHEIPCEQRSLRSSSSLLFQEDRRDLCSQGKHERLTIQQQVQCSESSCCCPKHRSVTKSSCSTAAAIPG